MLQLTVAGVAASLCAAAAAHGAGEPADGARIFGGVLAALLVASAFLYARGLRALWRKAGIGRGIRIAEAARFAIAWVVLAGALVSPLDAWASRSFAAHMVQHELLMVVAAPLFVLARPLEAWAWALAPALRRALASIVRPPVVRGAWRSLTSPAGAWCVHALALWVWHVPALFVVAVEAPALHAVQHASFFASALAFWWAVFGAAARTPEASSLVCLFTTMLHTSALGALLTIAPTPWYALDAQQGLSGLGGLEDQQLGGLIMWVPGSLAYIVAGLAIVATWLSPSRARRDLG